MAARLLCGVVLVACVVSYNASTSHAEADKEPSDKGVADERSNKPSLLQLQKKKNKCGPTPVKIFYQARNPESLHFINTTLRTVVDNEALRDEIAIQLQPFGNAFLVDEKEISKGYHFWHSDALFPLFMCENGENECMGNLIHACAEKVVWDPKEHLDFVICMASYGLNTSVELSSYECGMKHDIKMDRVKDCVTTQDGLDLMGLVAQDTKAAEIDQVPWILVDETHVKADKFLCEICSRLEDETPDACSKCPKVAPNKHKKKHIC
jgi:interferon gamma-inducible protein 30